MKHARRVRDYSSLMRQLCCYILPQARSTSAQLDPLAWGATWQLPMWSGRTANLAARRDAIRGGFRPLLFFSDSARSWSTPTGRRFRTAITRSVPTSRRSIRPRSSAIRRTPVRPQAVLVSKLSAVFSGAADSLDSRPLPLHLLLLPRRLLQSRSGPIRRRAPWASRARSYLGRTQLSARSCRISTAIFCGSPTSSGAFWSTTR